MSSDSPTRAARIAFLSRRQRGVPLQAHLRLALSSALDIPADGVAFMPLDETDRLLAAITATHSFAEASVYNHHHPVLLITDDSHTLQLVLERLIGRLADCPMVLLPEDVELTGGVTVHLHLLLRRALRVVSLDYSDLSAISSNLSTVLSLEYSTDNTGLLGTHVYRLLAWQDPPSPVSSQ